MTLEYPPHEANELKIRQLVRDTHINFLVLGKLLLENKENAYYSHHWGGFDVFTESLGVGSKSWVSRVMGMAELLRRNPQLEERIIRIGFSKMAMLLPAARKGELDEDTLLLAEDCTVVALKEHLGYKVQEMSDETLNCPNCGYEIHNVKWTKRDTQESISRSP